MQNELTFVEEKNVNVIDRFGEKKEVKIRIFKDKNGQHQVKFKVESLTEENINESTY